MVRYREKGHDKKVYVYVTIFHRFYGVNKNTMKRRFSHNVTPLRLQKCRSWH